MSDDSGSAYGDLSTWLGPAVGVAVTEGALAATGTDLSTLARLGVDFAGALVIGGLLIVAYEILVLGVHEDDTE